MAHHIPKITYGSGLIPTTITFDYPPVEPDPEGRLINRKVAESLSGVRQTHRFNVEAVRKLKFDFLSEAMKTALESFVDNWASLGKAFRYYDDQDGATYKTYELDQDKFDPKHRMAVGQNAYIYALDLKFRRVVDDAVVEGLMEQAILNNQAVSVDFAGLLLDSSEHKSVKIFYEIFRKTASSERVANGWFTCIYRESTGNWDIGQGQFEGDEHGVTFTITNAGQVGYTSDNQAGSSYEGNALLREFTILEG